MLYNFIQVFNFNPLPRKEGDLAGTVSNFLYLYFNPLPRKEGDIDIIAEDKKLIISIHSLVKRETICAYTYSYCIAISIHSLVKRETRI